MPEAGKPCPLCSTVQTVAGPLCLECLTERVGLTHRERNILVNKEPEAEYNALMNRIEWWVSGPPGETAKLNSFQ